MTKFDYKKSKSFIKSGFTIVELVVVIVVIGILVGITVVSYGSITKKTVIEKLKADLGSTSIKLMRYNADNGKYPTDINNCPNTDITKICAEPSTGNTFLYNTTGSTYSLYVENTNGESYYVTNTSATPAAGTAPIPSVTIGISPVQIWMSKNIDRGTMVNAPASMDGSNGVEEKYCYDNNSNNCTTYGGLYTWEEAMQGSVTPGAKGICYTGYHVPTDAEWKALETFLGMPANQLDLDNSWRGSAANVGTNLKVGGTSGFNSKQGGFYGGGFQYYGLTDTTGVGGYWTSSRVTWVMTQVPVNRIIEGPVPGSYVGRFLGDMMGFGDHMSVRCIKDA